MTSAAINLDYWWVSIKSFSLFLYSLKRKHVIQYSRDVYWPFDGWWRNDKNLSIFPTPVSYPDKFSFFTAVLRAFDSFLPPLLYEVNVVCLPAADRMVFTYLRNVNTFNLLLYAEWRTCIMSMDSIGYFMQIYWSMIKFSLELLMFV